MFFRLLLLTIMLIGIVEAKTYKDCGETKKDAIDNLAKSISVSVSSDFQKTESLSDDEVERKISNSSKQSTHLKLINVKISERNNQICASTTTKDLKLSLNGITAEIYSFQLSKLPKNQRSARETLLEKISECEQGKTLASVLGKKKTIKRLNRKLQSFKSKLEKVFAQSVQFNLDNGDLKIYIDGNKKHFFKINDEIPLKDGEHLYTIASKKYCDISGSFVLDSDEVLIIDNIDLEEYLYPRVNFIANQKVSDIELKIDSKTEEIGEHIFDRCSGTLNYQANYDDGQYKDGIYESIELKAGLNETISLNFLSIKDIKRTKNMAKAYTKGDRIEILYSYGFVNNNTFNEYEVNHKYIKDTHNLSINFLTHKRFFRYGYGFLTGIDDKNEPTNKIFEIYYQIAIQFSSFGDNKIPLHIGKMSFIPYFGIELGAGYHQYKTPNNKIYQYPIDGDDDYSKSAEDYDKYNWQRDWLLVKPIIGIDFILSQGFAIKLFAEKHLYIDNRWNIGTGLSIEF